MQVAAGGDVFRESKYSSRTQQLWEYPLALTGSAWILGGWGRTSRNTVNMLLLFPQSGVKPAEPASWEVKAGVSQFHVMKQTNQKRKDYVSWNRAVAVLPASCQQKVTGKERERANEKQRRKRKRKKKQKIPNPFHQDVSTLDFHYALRKFFLSSNRSFLIAI